MAKILDCAALNEALAKLEARFPFVNGLPCAFSQTREAYVVICTGGRKLADDWRPALAGSAEMAVKLWLAAVEEYAANRAGKLYWRVEPELSRHRMREVTDKEPNPMWAVPNIESEWWHVYSRLLISDRPALYPTIESLSRYADQADVLACAG